MDSKKKKILWLTIVVLILVGIFVLVWSLWKEDKVILPEDNYSVEDQPKFEVDSVPLEEPAELKPEQSVEFTVANLARSFTDRYGSWSTDNQGQNLLELVNISTPSMKNYLESIDLDYTSEFLGVTTKALSTEMISLDADAGQAVVMVQAQRIETRADLSKNIFYQKARLELVKSGDQWLVNRIVWQ